VWGNKPISAKVEWLNKPKYEIERLLSKMPVDVARENEQPGRACVVRNKWLYFIRFYATLL